MIGGDVGSPGIGLYHSGSTLGAVVSNGTHLWQLDIYGAAPVQDKWTHIALRWRDNGNTISSEDIKSEALSTDKVGGLELLLDGVPIGQTVSAESIQDVTKLEKGFDPPEIAIGCHRTHSDPEPRNHGGGMFDELAIWESQIRDADLPILMGGYGNTYLGIGRCSMNDLALISIFSRCHNEYIEQRRPFKVLVFGKLHRLQAG